MVSYLIDAVLAVMLVTATVYLVIVNRRLRVLQSGQSEINALIGQFSRTIDETDASVRRMVAAAGEVSGALAGELDRSKGVREELALLLESAGRTAGRIEESVRHARSLVRRLEGAPPRPAPAPAAGTEPAAPGWNAPEPAAPEPAPADAAAPFRPPAFETAERAPPRAANAFYARLRTLGTEA